MNTTRTRRIVAGALLSSSIVAAAGLALTPGIARATDGPYTWCPGQSMDWPTGPNRYGKAYTWDMNVCHTFYNVSYGYGNVEWGNSDVAPTLTGSSVWEGDNPPGPNPSGVNCGLFWCPVPPHYDPNFHG